MTIPAQFLSNGILFMKGAGVGTFGGVISGLLGITAGGVLVPALVVILGFSQHRAQALSLAALLPPTGISGVIHYQRQGHEISIRAVALLAFGFLAGSFCGAVIAGVIHDRVLRWMYVGYLVFLTLVLILRREHGHGDPNGKQNVVSNRLDAAMFVFVGLVAGVSSGLLGIGGGLAITVGTASLMGRPQHQAQALSLAVCLLPTGIPGVWVYISRDAQFPWVLLFGLVTGLVIGTAVGAKIATRLESRQLRYGLMTIISLNVVLMTWKAIQV